MKTKFSNSDLTVFGKYLLSDKRRNSIETGPSYKVIGAAALKEVYEADVCNAGISNHDNNNNNNPATNNT